METDTMIAPFPLSMSKMGRHNEVKKHNEKQTERRFAIWNVQDKRMLDESKLQGNGKKTVVIIGALDTKGEENLYLKKQLEYYGISVLVMDVGVLGEPFFEPDIAAADVIAEAGVDIGELRKRKDRNMSIALMGQGSATIVKRLYRKKAIQGAIAIGGSTVTYIGANVMRALPIGAPKVLISTIATIDRQQKPFEGINDTMVMNSLVVASGLNSILRMVIKKAAITLAGMVQEEEWMEDRNKPRIAITKYGITSACVSRVQEIFESKGYEVFVFHSTGLGGRVMENLIREGYISGVADITTSEVTHEFMGLNAHIYGPNRLETAGQVGIPQVVSLGGMDVVNYTPPESVPEKFKDRKFHMHNPSIIAMRTSVEENQMLGRIIASRLNKSKGSTTIVIPQKGVSSNDSPGGPFYDPIADEALFNAVRENIQPNISIVEMNNHINDKEFAEKIAELLIEKLEQGAEAQIM